MPTYHDITSHVIQTGITVCNISPFFINYAVVLTQEVKAPGGFPAASQTANLFQSQPSQNLVQSQGGPTPELDSQNLLPSSVPASNLFGNLAAPASSSAFAFGAPAGGPPSNPFGNLSVPSSSSAASPAPLFGGMSPAGSQALFGSAPANAFGAKAAAASASAAAETESAAVGVGSAPASRQGSGLFGFGSAQPNQQESGAPGSKSAKSQESAFPSASSAAAAAPDDPPDPSKTPNSTPQPLPFGETSSRASQFGRAASLQMPSAFGATQEQPFGKGPSAAFGGMPIQPWGKGKGPDDGKAGENEAVSAQALGKVSCLIADSILSFIL